MKGVKITKRIRIPEYQLGIIVLFFCMFFIDNLQRMLFFNGEGVFIASPMLIPGIFCLFTSIILAVMAFKQKKFQRVLYVLGTMMLLFIFFISFRSYTIFNVDGMTSRSWPMNNMIHYQYNEVEEIILREHGKGGEMVVYVLKDQLEIRNEEAMGYLLRQIDDSVTLHVSGEPTVLKKQVSEEVFQRFDVKKQ